MLDETAWAGPGTEILRRSGVQGQSTSFWENICSIYVPFSPSGERGGDKFFFPERTLLPDEERVGWNFLSLPGGDDKNWTSFNRRHHKIIENLLILLSGLQHKISERDMLGVKRITLRATIYTYWCISNAHLRHVHQILSQHDARESCLRFSWRLRQPSPIVPVFSYLNVHRSLPVTAKFRRYWSSHSEENDQFSLQEYLKIVQLTRLLFFACLWVHFLSCQAPPYWLWPPASSTERNLNASFSKIRDLHGTGNSRRKAKWIGLFRLPINALPISEFNK